MSSTAMLLAGRRPRPPRCSQIFLISCSTFSASFDLCRPYHLFLLGALRVTSLALQFNYTSIHILYPQSTTAFGLACSNRCCQSVLPLYYATLCLLICSVAAGPSTTYFKSWVLFAHESIHLVHRISLQVILPLSHRAIRSEIFGPTCILKLQPSGIEFPAFQNSVPQAFQDSNI